MHRASELLLMAGGKLFRRMDGYKDQMLHFRSSASVSASLNEGW